jgi:hypothetical protein
VAQFLHKEKAKQQAEIHYLNSKGQVQEHMGAK